MRSTRFIGRALIFLFVFFVYSDRLLAQVGKDGAKIIGATNTIVNDYTSLIADVNAGATSILVNSNAFTSGFTAPLATGDLIFIIQMQGAWMGYSDDSLYGDITGYLNCGNYEFAQVLSVSGSNTIRISC